MGKGSPPKAGKDGSPPKGKKSGPGVEDGLVMERKEQIDDLAKKIPERAKMIRFYVEQYDMQLARVAVWVERTGIPLLMVCFEYLKKAYEWLKPHYNQSNLSDIIPAIVGFLLCFFGGTFPLVIASYEAFRLAGYEGMKKATGELWVEGEKALVAHKKDSQEDLDGDGIPDVEQISPREKVTRKVLLLLRTVDPIKANTCFNCLATGMLAVLATLKMSFAQAIALGASLAEMLTKLVNKRVLPTLMKVVDPSYQKWIPIVIDYATKFIAVSIAMSLNRVISAFHSAMRGGQMCGGGIVRFLNRKKIIDFNEDDSYLDEAVGYGLAAFGMLYQLANWFGLPFPFSLLLWPVTLLEWSLSVAITWF